MPVATFLAEDGTPVRFEITPTGDDWQDASGVPTQRIQEAAHDALLGAKALLDSVKQFSPDSVEVKFGIKVTGSTNWLIARAASEASFEVTLSWQSKEASSSDA